MTSEYLLETFGSVIYRYTRAQALADGQQVEVTAEAKETGFTTPVFITRSAFDAYVAVPPGVTGQDERGRLHDVLWLLRVAVRVAAIRSPGAQRLPFGLYVRNDNHKARLAKLVATIGPRDLDDPAPAITVMMPDED